MLDDRVLPVHHSAVWDQLSDHSTHQQPLDRARDDVARPAAIAAAAIREAACNGPCQWSEGQPSRELRCAAVYGTHL